MKRKKLVFWGALLVVLLLLNGRGVAPQGLDIWRIEVGSWWQSLVVWSLVQILIFFDKILSAVGLPYHWGFAIIVFAFLIKSTTLFQIFIRILDFLRRRNSYSQIRKLQKSYDDDWMSSDYLTPLLQLIIFVGLYSALVEMRPILKDSQWFWISDLGDSSLNDGYGWFGVNLLLPLVLIVSQAWILYTMASYFETPFGNTLQDNAVQSISLLAVFICMISVLIVPAGFALYWVTINLLYFLQRWVFSNFDAFQLQPVTVANNVPWFSSTMGLGFRHKSINEVEQKSGTTVSLSPLVELSKEQLAEELEAILRDFAQSSKRQSLQSEVHQDVSQESVEAVKCQPRSHTYIWKQVENKCERVGECSTCGDIVNEEIPHTFQGSVTYARNDSCELGVVCEVCRIIKPLDELDLDARDKVLKSAPSVVAEVLTNNELLNQLHEWEKTILSPACETIQKCKRCGKTEKSVHHEWTKIPRLTKNGMARVCQHCNIPNPEDERISSFANDIATLLTPSGKILSVHVDPNPPLEIARILEPSMVIRVAYETLHIYGSQSIRLEILFETSSGTPVSHVYSDNTYYSLNGQVGYSEVIFPGRGEEKFVFPYNRFHHVSDSDLKLRFQVRIRLSPIERVNAVSVYYPLHLVKQDDQWHLQMSYLEQVKYDGGEGLTPLNR